MEEPHKGAFSKIFRVMAYFLVPVGYLMPGIENLGGLTRKMAPILRWFCIFPCFMEILFLCDCVVGTKGELDNRSLAGFVRKGISVMNMAVALHRLGLVHFKKKPINEVISYFDKLVSQGMGRNNKKKAVDRTVNILNSITLIHMVFSTVQTICFMSMTAIRFQRSPVPSVISKGCNLVIQTIYILLVQISFFYATTVYLFLLLVCLSIVTIEITDLKKELGQIFTIIHCDQNGNVFVKRNVFKAGLEDISTDSGKDDFEVNSRNVVAVETNPAFRESQTKVADEMLRKWITRYIEVIDCKNKLSEIFGMTVLIHYFSIVVMAASWIFTSLSGKYPLSLAVYSMTNIIVFYILCNYGDNLVLSGSSVAFDAIGRGYHLYPLKMQKALLLTIVISQQRLITIDISTLDPVSLAMFFQVLQRCYSIFSFFAGVGSSDD